ncbi:MAG: putative Ig domain-containing protein [Acidobacteriales bacterium]|nr:putative Ig domain-containing protein [Terriglobales bacterium]
MIRTALAAIVAAISLAAAEPGILTPKASPKPRINGAKVYGARPGHPFLYRVPASGERPMSFSAKGLPAGLTLDARTGIITGTTPAKGEYTIRLRASNKKGSAQRAFKIVAGDTLALTPPMGYSTWYHCYTKVSDELVRAEADAMVSSGLADHGYSYVNIDDGWNRYPAFTSPEFGPPVRDPDGNLRPNAKFPDMKALTDYIHAKGLKAGIYIGPGPLTCAKCEASWQHEEQDARQFARWGFDFLKYDWCAYSKVAKDKSLAELKKPYQLMGDILKRLDRDFVYNLCQYGMGDVWQWGREVGGNFWRTTGDVGIPKNGTFWNSIEAIGFSQDGKEQWAGPGGWNDPDNINIGQIIWNKKVGPTPLTPNEQYSYVSLWSLLAAPLFFGGDMTRFDDFTLSLLTNDEVIEVNQDVLGKQGRRVWKDGTSEVWAKPLEDGSLAVGLFNRGEAEARIVANWTALGIQGKRKVRDLWRQRDLGAFDGKFETAVGRHGVVLIRVR